MNVQSGLILFLAAVLAMDAGLRPNVTPTWIFFVRAAELPAGFAGEFMGPFQTKKDCEAARSTWTAFSGVSDIVGGACEEGPPQSRWRL